MEMLNNIWNAISTPNQDLVNIFMVFFAIFAEAPLSLGLITTLFNIKLNNKQKYIYIIVLSIISILSLYVIKPPYNTVLNYILSFFMILVLFKVNIIKSLLGAVFPSIIFSLLGFLLINPYITILNIPVEIATNTVIHRIPFSIIMYFIVFLIITIFKNNNFKINILSNLDNKNKSIIILNILFGVFYIVMQSILTINYADMLPITFTFFNFIALLVYFGLSFYSLIKVMNLVTTTEKLENAEEYNKTLHILHDSVRGFKHDFDNIVTTIGGYIKTNDMDGLKNYYSQLEDDCSRVNNLYVLNPDIINNPGIYSLLTTKYSKAQDFEIKVNLTFLLDLNKLNMKIYEFTRILGILLDNAIESALECEDKIINIEFRDDSKNNRNIILVENTYKNKDVNIDEIFNKGTTGKENHTGLGLWEIRQMLKKNNNVNLYTTKNDKYFSQQLEIYY